MTVQNNCPTKNKRRGRPPKPGRSIPVTVRLREGEHDSILARLRTLPKGKWSSYIRRILDGARIEALDEALQQESASLTADLDGMWDDEWDEE